MKFYSTRRGWRVSAPTLRVAKIRKNLARPSSWGKGLTPPGSTWAIVWTLVTLSLSPAPPDHIDSAHYLQMFRLIHKRPKVRFCLPMGCLLSSIAKLAVVTSCWACEKVDSLARHWHLPMHLITLLLCYLNDVKLLLIMYSQVLFNKFHNIGSKDRFLRCLHMPKDEES
jgi:hypothetical protein